MKTLIIYYSRTGITKKVAEQLAKELNADIEEIISIKDRKGAKGYLLCGKEAVKKISAEIKPIKKDPANYNLVLIGTPVWIGKMASPIRTYIMNNKSRIKNAAFFCTEYSSGAETTFREMQKLLNKKDVKKLRLTTKQIKKGNYISQVKDFVKEIK